MENNNADVLVKKNFINKIEEKLKKHIALYLLVSFILGSIVGPIIVQNYIWSKEPQIVLFAANEIIPINVSGVYNIESYFFVHNPKDTQIVVDNQYVKIPNQIFYGTPYDPTKPRIRQVTLKEEEINSNVMDVEPKTTRPFKVTFSINASKDGMYPITYCIKSLGKELCSENVYTQIEVKI